MEKQILLSEKQDSLFFSENDSENTDNNAFVSESDSGNTDNNAFVSENDSQNITPLHEKGYQIEHNHSRKHTSLHCMPHGHMNYD